MSTIVTSPTSHDAVDHIAAAIDEIVDTYHREIRRQLPRFHLILANVAAHHGLAHCGLQQLAELFLELESLFCAHIGQQEDLLFPLVTGRGDADLADCFIDDGKSIAELFRELRQTDERLKGVFTKIADVTDGYQPPTEACEAYRRVVRGLAELDDRTHAHLTAEGRLMAGHSD